jgi:uncharacterized membrane protein YhhN
MHLLSYFIISIIAIFGEITSNQLILMVFKPLICFSLILFLFNNNYRLNFTLIYLAMLFSMLGDFILIFPKYFVIGLILFLMAHLSYIYAFIRQSRIKTHVTKLIFWLLISVVIVYIKLFYDYIKNSLGELNIPVLIYMMVLSLMFISSYLRKPKPGYYLVIFGAFWFVVSDSLIAINQFIKPFWYSGAIILATYVLAQFFIVFGCTKFYNTDNIIK